MILRTLATTVIFASTAMTAMTPAVAADASTAAPAVTASGGWIRVLPGALPAGGYVTFENTGDRALSVVGAESADYGDAMIHRSSTAGGVGRMQMVDNVPLPPKATVAFAPGGYHVMLMGPKHAIKAGDKVVVTFELSDHSKLPVTLVARPANATGPAD